MRNVPVRPTYVCDVCACEIRMGVFEREMSMGVFAVCGCMCGA